MTKFSHLKDMITVNSHPSPGYTDPKLARKVIDNVYDDYINKRCSVYEVIETLRDCANALEEGEKE